MDVGYGNKPLQSVAPYGYDGSIWRPLAVDLSGRMLVKPYSSIDAYVSAYLERQYNLSLAAGSNALSTTIVPAGQVHVYNTISYYYAGTVATVVLQVYLNDGATSAVIGMTQAPTSGLFYSLRGPFVVPAGGKIVFTIDNATLNDDAVLDVSGYRSL